MDFPSMLVDAVVDRLAALPAALVIKERALALTEFAGVCCWANMPFALAGQTGLSMQ
ncbi:MAG: hypothetical protein GY906_28430 [bacterium]|nr:hypothetical protein [bacterium]